jgi:2-polyprenyl-6-methoxyphenol hydroxylase-like FAD-dependent oxidoreductase
MRVLISGGGIAGPALAFWLSRAGADVTVVEKAPAPRPGGQTVDIRGVARTVVERMGLMATVRADLVDERGMTMVDDHGRRVAEVPADAFGGEGIVAELEIIRGDLARILYEATAGDAHYVFGDRITELTPDATGVDVRFAGGGTGRYDIVVGADGVHSGVRALAFGPEEEFVRYLGGYTSYFSVTDPGDLDHWMAMYQSPGGRVALLRPLGGGRAMAGLSFTSAERLGRLTDAEQRTVVAQRLAGAGWHVPRLLAELPDAPDFFFDELSQVEVDTWARGRVVLLGDAATCGSPLGGLGTSVSLVGAYVLAGELLAARSPEVAFAAYQDRMAAYAKSSRQLPPGGIHGFAPRSALRIRLSRLSFRMITRWPSKQIMQRMADRADAITLPGYDFDGRHVYR